MSPHSTLPDLLTLFFRDDMASWAARRGGGLAGPRGSGPGQSNTAGGGAAGLRPAQLRTLVDQSTEACLRRVKGMPLLHVLQLDLVCHTRQGYCCKEVQGPGTCQWCYLLHITCAGCQPTNQLIFLHIIWSRPGLLLLTL